MSTELHVVGFAADIVGSENEIIEAAPAFVRSDDLTRVYVATGLDWSLASATELLVGDEQFIHFVRPADRTTLSEGHTVWVAGRAFADSVRSSSWTSRIASPITGWDTLTNGFRWGLGHRTKFHELVTAISNGLEQGLHHSLFDSLEKSHGDADRLISLYSSLPVPSGRRQLVNRALYAQETRDEYSFEFIRTLAVEVERTHQNSDSFRRDVATLSDSLRQKRLAESSDERIVHQEAIFDPREFAQIHNVWSRIGMGVDLTKTLEALSKLQRASGNLPAERSLYPRG